MKLVKKKKVESGEAPDSTKSSYAYSTCNEIIHSVQQNMHLGANHTIEECHLAISITFAAILYSGTPCKYKKFYMCSPGCRLHKCLDNYGPALWADSLQQPTSFQASLFRFSNLVMSVRTAMWSSSEPINWYASDLNMQFPSALTDNCLRPAEKRKLSMELVLKLVPRLMRTSAGLTVIIKLWK